jgi:hypothetical protein
MTATPNNLVVASTHSAPRPLLARLLKNLPTHSPRLKSPSLTCAERLEPRQMLSAITHPLDSDVVVEGEFHTFTAATSVHDRTFIDNLNNKVTFNIAGSGSVTLFQADNGEILTVDVDGAAAAKTSLHILVNSQGHKGTGTTTIADIDIDADGLNFFNASKVNISHHFISQGTVRSVTLGDIAGPIQANITIGGTSSDNTSMSLGALDDVSIRTGASVTFFKAQDWQDNNDIQDSFEASSLKLLFITGRNESKSKGHVVDAGLPGNFDADLHLTYTVPIGTPPNSPAARPMVNVVQIHGSSSGDWDLGAHKLNVTTIRGDVTGDWTANGGFNLITVLGMTTDFHVNTTQGINQIKLGQVSNSSIDAGGNINAVAVLEWIGGSITADRINVLTTFGRGAVKGHSPSLSGDFAVDLLINNEASTKNSTAVGFINIKGDASGDRTFNGIGNADWIIAGGAGFIRIGGDVDTLNIDIRAKADNPGNLGVFWVAGNVTNSELDVTGKLGMVRLAQTDGFGLAVGGSLGVLFAGNLVNTNVDVGGSIGPIQITGWNRGTLNADKIAVLQARAFHGNKFIPSGSGDLVDLNINLSGDGLNPRQLVLGPVQVAGRVESSVWRVDGNVGPVTVGAFLSSTLFVGVNNDVLATTFPTALEFNLYDGKTATLLGFTITGKAVAKNSASFDASRIAAGTLQNVSLKLVNPDAIDLNGLVAQTRIGSYTRLIGPGPNNTIRVTNKTTLDTYDSDGTYSLKIV